MWVQNEGIGKSFWWIINLDGGKSGKVFWWWVVFMDNSNKYIKSCGCVVKKKVVLQIVFELVDDSFFQFFKWFGSFMLCSSDELDVWMDFCLCINFNVSIVSGCLLFIMVSIELDEVQDDDVFFLFMFYSSLVSLLFLVNKLCMVELLWLIDMVGIMNLNDGLIENFMDDLLDNIMFLLFQLLFIGGFMQWSFSFLYIIKGLGLGFLISFFNSMVFGFLFLNFLCQFFMQII